MSNDQQSRRRLGITHVTTFYPPHNFGGDGVHVQRLARAQVRRGHRVSVVYAPGAFALLDRRGGGSVGGGDADDGVTVHALGGTRGRIEPFLVHQTGHPVLFRQRLRRLLDGSGGDGPDVVHFHNVSLLGGSGVLTRGQGAVRLFTPHEYWAVCPTHLLFRYGREPCTQRTCIRCTVRSGRPPQWWRYVSAPQSRLAGIDRIVFPSEVTQSVYRNHGVDQAAVLWRHFLPDDYLASAAAKGARGAEVAPYFLYAGRLDAVKGVAALARSFASGQAPAPLWLAGHGPLDGELRTRHGGNPAIRFLGNQDHESLGRLYRDALALILPSAGYEVFGQVVVEAYAHATPAIVTAIGGARELVHDSGAGYVYATDSELMDASRQLAAHRTLRDRLGQRGRAWVQRELSESDYMARYESLVQEIAAP